MRRTEEIRPQLAQEQSVGTVTPRQQRGNRLGGGAHQTRVQVLIQRDEQWVQERFELPLQLHRPLGRYVHVLREYGIIHHRTLPNSIGRLSTRW